MAGAPTFIGAIISVSANTPATVDAAGFNALTYTPVYGVTQMDGLGDTSGTIEVPLLSGRKDYANDIADGGVKKITFAFKSGDAGQTILLNNSNGTTTISVKRLDPDGKISYAYGLASSFVELPAQAGQFKGYTGELMIQSATVRV